MSSALVTSAAVLIFLTQISVLQSSKPAEKLPPPCSVSGRVVTAADGTPLKSSQVALIPEPRTRESQVYAATSDSAGQLMIKGVRAGRYRFVATYTGYVEQHYQSNGADEGAVLALHAGQEVRDGLFRMTLAGVITGRANDEDGEAALVQIVALCRPTDEEMEEREDFSLRSLESLSAGMAQTDDRGQYRIFGLKPGEYNVKAVDQYEPIYQVMGGSEWEVRDALGSRYAPIYSPGVTQMGQAETVLLTPGEYSGSRNSVQSLSIPQHKQRSKWPLLLHRTRSRQHRVTAKASGSDQESAVSSDLKSVRQNRTTKPWI